MGEDAKHYPCAAAAVKACDVRSVTQFAPAHGMVIFCTALSPAHDKDREPRDAPG
jgi:hypothetical protein